MSLSAILFLAAIVVSLAALINLHCVEKRMDAEYERWEREARRRRGTPK